MNTIIETKGILNKFSGIGTEPETDCNKLIKNIGICSEEAYNDIKDMLSNYDKTKEIYNIVPVLNFYEDGNFYLSLVIERKKEI